MFCDDSDMLLGILLAFFYPVFFQVQTAFDVTNLDENDEARRNLQDKGDQEN